MLLKFFPAPSKALRSRSRRLDAILTMFLATIARFRLFWPFLGVFFGILRLGRPFSASGAKFRLLGVRGVNVVNIGMVWGRDGAPRRPFVLSARTPRRGVPTLPVPFVSLCLCVRPLRLFPWKLDLDIGY